MAEQDNYDDELVSSNPNQRNWRGMLIALLVIIIVWALIVTSVVLLTPPDEGPRVKGDRIKLQDIVDGQFLPRRTNGTWINAEEFIYQDNWGRISLLNAANLSERVLMSNVTFKTLAPHSFSISADKRYLLLAQNVVKLFRHSFLAQYTLFDIQTSESIKLRVDAEEDEWPYLHYARFSPSGNALVLVYNYDIYYSEGPRAGRVHRVSRDAVPGVVYNGIPDWLYEEEILQTNHAIWLSEDGRQMLFGSFDDSHVQEQHFAWYGTTGGGSPSAYLYPEIRSLRYPKPGTQNPRVSLRVADLTDPEHIRLRELQPPQILMNEDHYFTSASWVGEDAICVVWLNRPQNLSVVSICQGPAFECIETHRVSGDGRGWVDTTAAPLFAANASTYVAISPLRDGTSGYFRHIVHVHVHVEKRVLPLTHGQYEVNRLLHWDQLHNWIYFLGTPEMLPSQQHLYRVSAVPPRHGSALQAPECLTCPAQPTGAGPEGADGGGQTRPPPPRLVTAWDDDWEDWGDRQTAPPPAPPTPAPERNAKGRRAPPEGPANCLYHTAQFPRGPDARHVLVECLGPVVPTTALYAIAPGPVASTAGAPSKGPLELLLTLQNNTRLKEKLARTALPQAKTFPVMISGGYHAQVRLLLPPVLREDEITRYPTILHVYSGPGSQLVTDKWHVDWNTYLAGTKDYVVVQIDGRGSAGQGYQLLHEVYKRLGTVEVSDQLEVSEYLRDNLHFIDGRRMGVWGWSYGGYTAALALASSQSIFQCGISVSPVTNWKLYDSTYAERYLSFPNVTDNYKGYEEGDLSKYVDSLRERQFLLVHGTADDNVHVQQSMVLARALTNRGVLYKQQIYPDEGHNLAGVKRHLYRSMTGFFEDCFKKLVPPESKAGLGSGGDMQQQ